jgi:hypothetical protein
VKIYWRDGGIMVEPEDKPEIDALMILWERSQTRAPVAEEFRSPAGSTGSSGLFVHSNDSVIVS